MSDLELKSKIVKKINAIKDSRILTELHDTITEMKSYQSKDFWDELNSSQKKNIELSLKQSKEGKTISHEQVKQWLKK
jgi:hypothetical protein